MHFINVVANNEKTTPPKGLDKFIVIDCVFDKNKASIKLKSPVKSSFDESAYGGKGGWFTEAGHAVGEPPSWCLWREDKKKASVKPNNKHSRGKSGTKKSHTKKI